MALSIALILGSVGPSGRKQMASVFSARVLMAWPLSCPMFYSSTAGAGPAVTPMKKIVWNVREWRSCDSLEFTLLKINIPALTFSVISNKLLSTCSQQTPWEKNYCCDIWPWLKLFSKVLKNRWGVCGHFWRSVHQRPFKSCPTAFNLKMSVDRRMGFI